ncbi:hypothetical protein CDQ92_13310 [Sphingopyxis bauzanensis]|uniref:Uncharacterized protein n=1 Tax=Sphingopyxis bauzanensis TaxID=651663 RepID=A0A246JRW6_9SPHN|nr:hypothetical protein [Sphingopyxis bauzanensis]OWQ95755.1 hypothetical protein CDQ92_13310 [Sphingopyxis bauzanensis]GGJ39771.1 hypothetical protein GCM10011393_07510 [Sphingopyxis bauzanensis]
MNNDTPAFPACNEANVNGTMGMSLRDWFAGQAIAGICAASIGRMLDGSNESTLAYGAYVVADEMLAAREQVK